MRPTLAALALILAMVPSAAPACSCSPGPAGAPESEKVLRAKTEARAVFAGTAKRVIADPASRTVRVLLSVEKVWKGGVAAETVVGTGRGHGDCGYPFEEGGAYLVYAFGSDDEHLGTSTCTRTRRAADAAGDEELLGKPGRAKAAKKK